MDEVRVRSPLQDQSLDPHQAPAIETQELSTKTPGATSSEPTLLRFVFFGADGLRAGWSLLAFAGLVSFFWKAMAMFAHRFHSAPPPGSATSPTDLIFAEGTLLFVVCAATWVVSRLERRPLRSYGIGRTPGALRQLLTGTSWGVVLLGLLVAALWLTHLLVFTAVLLSGGMLLRFAVEWAFGFLLVALLEEYLLRGFVQFTLARGIGGALRATTDSPYAAGIGFWVAAALLSFVFGLGHSSNPGESPIGLLSAGLIGLVFCLSLWRTGSLWWAIGFHAAWDWMQSFVFGVADSGTLVRFHLLASHSEGRPLLSGGTTGPEGSLYILPITCVIVAVILLTLPRTRSMSYALSAEPSR